MEHMVVSAAPTLRIFPQGKLPDGEIPVDSISPNPEQPRQAFDTDQMAELLQSVKAHGVLAPIVVERNGAGFILIDGERRWRAAKAAGLRTIPATIRKSESERNHLVQALILNLQRADMTLPEEGLAYRRLIEEYGIRSEAACAHLLGIAPIKVYNAVSSLKMEPEIQKLIIERKLPNTPETYRSLAKLPAGEIRIKLANALANHRCTIQGIKSACSKLVKELEATDDGTLVDKSHVPAVQAALDLSGRDEIPLPEWDALYQLGKVPSWSVVNDALMATCDSCALRNIASDRTCGQCPLVQAVRKMMEAAK